MTTTPFTTNLPIAIGDAIGIDVDPSGSVAFVSGTTAILNRWSTSVPDGGPPQQPATNPYELALNADIEPTATLSAVQATPRKGGKLQVSMQVPNAGTLLAGDVKNAALAASTSAKKPQLLKSTSAQAAAAGPLTILIKPTRAAKALLAATGKVKAKLKLVFTPTGGNPASQIVRVKLKR
jgi:hypothetical protein